MAVKVLVTTIGQQILADVSQVENTETKEVVGYWVKNPRVVNYTRNEETGDVGVNFGSYCLVTSESEFAIRAETISSILEPTTEVAEGYTKAVYGDNPPTEAPAEGSPVEVTGDVEAPTTEDVNLDEPSTTGIEDGTAPGLTD